MHALHPSHLPSHPTLARHQQNQSPPSLPDFLTALLSEATAFLSTTLPTFHLKSRLKPSPPSTARVDLFSCQRQNETWFARTSIHVNAAEAGTASWAEFDAGLRERHSENERDYTPGVKEAAAVLRWEGLGEVEGGWRDVGLEVREMVHHIPSPLKDRVFPVLVATARRKEKDELLVVQVPVNLRGVETAKYTGGSGSGGTVTGMYCSIERAEVVEGGEKVRWEMATASDAKGALPMWAQKLGVPGAVVKDVGLFIDWTGKRREGSKGGS